MSYLFFDTETTGLPSLIGDQARICQLGAILTDDDGAVKAEANLLVKPEGWTIPEQASQIHGIRQEDAARNGVPMSFVLMMFHFLANRADRVVAHNIDFDLQMLRIEEKNCGLKLPDFDVYCTMQGSTPILKLPPTGRMVAAGYGGGFKNPNLQEAHQFFFGRKFDGAHDAMADVRACRDVFFAIQRGVAIEVSQ